MSVKGSIGYTRGRIDVVQGTVLAWYRGVLVRRGEYWRGTGGSIGYTGGVGVTVGERIAGEVICEVAVGKNTKAGKLIIVRWWRG